MKNYISINHEDKKIIIARKIAKKVEAFGSSEYRLLQEARRDYPTFIVEIEEKKSSKRNSFKGLTFDYMKGYILKHDPSGEIMKEFNNLVAEDDIAEELGLTSASYGEVKAWFLNSYPEINSFLATREKILGKAIA